MDDPIEAELRSAREFRTLGRLIEAYQAYGRAALSARAEHKALPLAHALRHVSDVGRELGKLHEALAAGQEAISIYRAEAKQSSLDLANALRVTALAFKALGRLDEARPIWQEAKSLYADVNVEAGVAECQANL